MLERFLLLLLLFCYGKKGESDMFNVHSSEMNKNGRPLLTFRMFLKSKNIIVLLILLIMFWCFFFLCSSGKVVLHLCV